MSALKKKIQAVMAADRKNSFSILESFLFLLSLGYGTAVKLRNAGYKKEVLTSKRLPAKVISVGNITTGGTGKTPMTVHLARRIHQLGYGVAVISRGYKGIAEKAGGIVSNGREIQLGPLSAGDEPYMMAVRLRNIGVPVLVGQKRYRIGLMAVKEFNPDVIILDDGFQHLNLMRDINLVLLDSRRPFANKHLLPRGPLREPLSSLVRADVFILTRCDFNRGATETGDLAGLSGYLKGRRIYKTSHVPVLYKWIKANKAATDADDSPSCSHDLSALKGKKVFAFSGIAENNDFKNTLENLPCDLTGFLGFPDHHSYSENDFLNILDCQRIAGADLLCTTEKDYVRIFNKSNWPTDLAVIGVEISFGEDDGDFHTFIKNRLEED